MVSAEWILNVGLYKPPSILRMITKRAKKGYEQQETYNVASNSKNPEGHTCLHASTSCSNMPPLCTQQESHISISIHWAAQLQRAIQPCKHVTTANVGGIEIINQLFHLHY